MNPAALKRVRVGKVIAYVLACGVFVIRIMGGDLPLLTELPGAIALVAVVAISPTIVKLTPNRPLGWLSAGVIAAIGLLGLSVIALPMVVIGVVWMVAYGQSRLRPGTGRLIAAAVLPLALSIAAFAAVIIHLDPRCVETLDDGTTRSVASEEESGWAWEVDGTSTGTQVVGDDVSSVACSSDVVLPPEALAVVALSASAVATGWRIATPTGYSP